MNPGGIRADLSPVSAATPGEVTYEEVFTVQPFGNTLTVKTLHRRADPGAARAAVRLG